RKVVGVATKGKMMQPLALAFEHQAPAVLVAVGVEPERIAVLAHVEAEVLVEILRRLEVRHRQHEVVERVDADRVAVGRGWHVAADRGHRISPGGKGAFASASITIRASTGEAPLIAQPGWRRCMAGLRSQCNKTRGAGTHEPLRPHWQSRA